MEKMKNNKLVFFIAILIAIVTLAYFFAFFVFLKYDIFPKPSSVPENLNEDFSRLNQLTPGKSTAKDLVKINGEPASTTEDGEKTYFYYRTPIEELDNKVLVENDVIVYALENIFADYRGKYSDFTSKYGQPSMTLYNTINESDPWYVFLDAGVMIKSAGESINGIVYFVPQSEESFFENIATDFGLSADNLEDEGAPVYPGF